ncbi:hypothetical protein [Bradyrhizobium sp.]|uniref:hypothetical protein n=1 Tax=Bradyrhizobium sp. TaxID=376 RepID=UPI0025C39BD8|nr:hypothetical protein [Bradyrhizobium sp.]
MIGISGVIGDAAADVRALLDQRDAKTADRLVQQLVGQQDAAGAAADNDDMSAIGTRHAVAPSISRSRRTRNASSSRYLNACRYGASGCVEC